MTSSTYAASNGPCSDRVRTSPTWNSCCARPEPRRHVPREPDAPRVGIDPHDAPPRVRLPEVRREQPKPAPDVQDAALVGQQQVHDAQQLRPQDREAHPRVRPLDRRQRADDLRDRAPGRTPPAPRTGRPGPPCPRSAPRSTRAPSSDVTQAARTLASCSFLSRITHSRHAPGFAPRHVHAAGVNVEARNPPGVQTSPPARFCTARRDSNPRHAASKAAALSS